MKKRILHALAAGCLALAVSISVLAQPVTAYASLKSSTEEEKRVIFGDFIGEDKHTGVISYPEKKEVIVREDLQNLMLLSKDREHLIYQKTDGGIYTSAPDGADETLIVNGIEEPRSLGIYGDVFWFCDNYVYYTGTTVYSYNLKTKTLTKALENTTHIIGGKYMEREGENLNFYFVDHDSGQMSRVGQCSTKDFGEYVECPYLDFNESGGAMIITGSEKK